MKNWIVKAKPLTKKGAEKHQEYLLDINNKSHAATENIIHLSGDFDKIMDEHDLLMMTRFQNNKGGRPPKNVGRSLVFSLPKGIRPSPETWSKVVDNSLNEISKVTNIPKEDLSHFAVLHDEPTKNSHIHFLLGQNPNGLYNKKLTNTTMITACKIAFNRTIKEEMNLSNEVHIPKKTGVKDIPLWQFRAKKKLEDMKELKANKEALKEQLDEIVANESEIVKQLGENHALKVENKALKAENIKERSKVKLWIENGLKYIKKSLKGDKATKEAVKTVNEEPEIEEKSKKIFYEEVSGLAKNDEIKSVKIKDYLKNPDLIPSNEPKPKRKNKYKF